MHLLRPKVDGKGSDDPERERFLKYVWARKDRISELKQVTEQELDNTFRQLMTAYFRKVGALSRAPSRLLPPHRDLPQYLRLFRTMLV